VWVLFCLAFFAVLISAILFVNCRIYAVLFLEPSGGSILLRLRFILPFPPFCFRIALLQPPFLAIDLLKRNGQISPVYRAFQKKEKANPWGAAIWNSARWKRVQAHLFVGLADSPASAVLLWGAAKQALDFLIKKHLTQNTSVGGRPTNERTTVRLKVEGIATVRIAQIILEQYRLKKENRDHHGSPY